jgi:prephenate dehydrogenase
MKAQNVSIIGLGRVGASVGLAVKRSPLELTVVGHDRRPEVAKIARDELKAVDKLESNVANLAARADLLILAVPLSELEPLFSVIGDLVQPHALVLDFSSLKQPGLNWAAQHLKSGHYVGASPALAAEWLSDGRTETEAASADLFRNSVFCLSPSPQAEPQAVETAVQFGSLLGATPYFVDPLEYDSLVQGLEAVPGLLAAAMFRTLTETAGWRDMLRFAGQPFALTTQPLSAGAEIAYQARQNKAATLRWLDALIGEITAVRHQLAADDPNADLLPAILSGLGEERQRWLFTRTNNNWDEIRAPEIEKNTFSSHFFGSLGRKRD